RELREFAGDRRARAGAAVALSRGASFSLHDPRRVADQTLQLADRRLPSRRGLCRSLARRPPPWGIPSISFFCVCGSSKVSKAPKVSNSVKNVKNVKSDE